MSSSAEVGTYRRLFAEKYAMLEELLADIEPAALLWKPFERSPWCSGDGDYTCNSLGEIVAHAVSSTVYLLRRAEYSMGRLAWEQVDGDEGSEEFGPANHDPAYLRTRVRRSHMFVNNLLDSLTAENLEASHYNTIWQRELPARYDIQHAIEHMSQHIGHAQLTRQLWAIAAEKQT